MDWSHQTAPWNTFPQECLYYLFPGLLIHLIVLVISLGLILVFSSSRCYPTRISTILVFNVVFLFLSMLANGIWSCQVWGNLYYSTDYISDFSPLYPIRQAVIDMPFGHQVGSLNGISLLNLNLTWMIFTVITWVASILVARSIIYSNCLTRRIRPTASRARVKLSH